MTEFNGNLGKYKIIQTEDNTETIWSEYFDEACHNLSGAYEETLHNYILGCAIPDLLVQDTQAAVLDVGFGVGVGLKALIDQVKQSPKRSAKLYYYSIELDETLLQWSLKHTLPELHFELRSLETEHGLLKFYQGHYQELDIQIFVGDGRVTLPRAQLSGRLKPLDAVFQDAFSPRKNPGLWSTEWFQFLKEISTKKVVMSTYSSSVSIRKSMLAAGWSIESARGFALKRTMTKANLMGVTSAELLLQLSRSPSLEIKDK